MEIKRKFMDGAETIRSAIGFDVLAWNRAKHRAITVFEEIALNDIAKNPDLQYEENDFLRVFDLQDDCVYDYLGDDVWVKQWKE